jgi:hypothetical protein
MENLYSRLAPALIAIIELLLMGAAAVVIVRPRREKPGGSGSSSFQVVERSFGRLARRRALAVLTVGVGAIGVRTLLIPILGVPEPRWNDEFSYLLAADTFANGRVTNPPHPMWVHFESFHINQQPTYMSKYSPAQGLVLAAGQLLGHPWIGQLLITGAMCSALCWMLQRWLPPRWALFGAILAALRLAVLSYWINAYWSASVVAFGGALVLGAWPRLRSHPSIRMSLILGFGLLVLANSRPYEGLAFAIPIAILMMAWLAGANRPSFGQSVRKVLLPTVAVLVLGALATGYYNYRNTGSPLFMPYEVNRIQYETARYFLWQKPLPEPIYHHAEMRDYYRWEEGEFEQTRTLRGYLLRALDKVAGWWRFYLGPLLTLPFLAMPWVLRDRRVRVPIVLCVATAVAIAVETWMSPHYFAPAAGALYILLVQGIRHLRQWRRRSGDLGLQITRAILLVACAMIVLRVTAAASHTHIEPDWPRGNLERASMLRQLQRMPGMHLVLVRYGPHHDTDREWVWNDASIDASKVVWARDMGRESNVELIQYFRGRKVWFLEADHAKPQLQPYPE